MQNSETIDTRTDGAPADFPRAAMPRTRRDMDALAEAEYSRGFDAGAKTGRMHAAAAFRLYFIGIPLALAGVIGFGLGVLL